MTAMSGQQIAPPVPMQQSQMQMPMLPQVAVQSQMQQQMQMMPMQGDQSPAMSHMQPMSMPVSQMPMSQIQQVAMSTASGESTPTEIESVRRECMAIVMPQF